MMVSAQSAPFRVLVVTNLWPYTADPGYGAFVQAQMESLRALGVEYDLLFINGRESKWNYMRGIGQLRKCLKAGSYDLIHAHFGLSGWVARCQLRLPVVVSFLGDDVLGRPRRDGSITLYGRFLQASSLVLARIVSAVIVKNLPMRQVLGLPSAHVIPNGVDLELFRPMDSPSARKELGLDPSKKFVLFPYDPAIEGKRFDLIEAAVGLASKHIPELEILMARGAPAARMPLFMNAADMLVLASMQEGSPNAVKEAMACNLPVIAVDVGDVAQLFGSAEGCNLVPRDAGAIAASMIEVCRKGGRSRGREQIARLSIENVAAQVVEIYRNVLGRG
jgi:teichuronic acid biosynthesis glycosyltransferase TuaC